MQEDMDVSDIFKWCLKSMADSYGHKQLTAKKYGCNGFINTTSCFRLGDCDLLALVSCSFTSPEPAELPLQVCELLAGVSTSAGPAKLYPLVCELLAWVFLQGRKCEEWHLQGRTSNVIKEEIVKSDVFKEEYVVSGVIQEESVNIDGKTISLLIGP